MPIFSKFVRKAKSSSEIKNRSAEKVLESKGVEQPGQNEINQIINQSANVGHSWIKLTLLEGGNSLGTFSFGFVPGADVQHPAQPVAGVVRNPDIAYETTANTRFIDTEVSQKNFRNGLKKVTKLHAAPPDYTTSGYNCTKFAREVAKSAGATFPGGTGLMIPISDLGLFQKAYNPGKLYDKLGASEDSYTESPEQEALETGHGMNDEGQIISPEEAAAEREANWSENDVVDQLIRNRYFVSDEHDANEITIETGLTGMLLEKLSAASIRSMARDDPGAHALYLVFNAFDVTVPDGIDFYWWTPRGEDADFYEPEWRIRGVTPRY